MYMGLTPGAATEVPVLRDEAFLLLFRRMPAPALLVEDRTNRILDLNPTFQTVFGWKREAVVGQLDAEFPLWGNPQQHQKMLDSFDAAPSSSQLDYTLRRRDGSLKKCSLAVESLVIEGTTARLYLFQPLASGEATVTERLLSSQQSAPPARIDSALRQSQDSLSLALDAAQMGIWDWEIATGLLNTSHRTAALHGYPDDAWKGRLSEFMAKVPPQDKRAMRRAFIAICRGQQQRYRLTYRIKHEGAAWHWLEVTATLHRDPSGKALRMVGTLLDITKRRRNEQALLESESKFSNLFQGFPDPCSLINLDSHVIIEVNRSFIRSFGYQPEQVIGRSIMDIGFWKPGDQHEIVLGMLNAGEVLRGVQVSLRGKQGRAHICEMSSALFTINRQRCVLLSFRDISARKLAEAALRASENKFALAFKASPDSMSISERDTGIHLEINEGFTRLTGFSASEVIGRTADELEIWSDVSERDKLMAELSAYGRIQQKVMHIRNKYDQICTVSVSVEPLELNDADCLLITARDITEQKRIEARIKHLAYHDALTDLPNRLLLNDRLTQNIALYQRHRLKGALLFFDLDHFKHINDSLGHSSGDAVLQEVTRRLLMVVRQEDTVARLGGDEFVVLISGLEEDDPYFMESIHSTAEKLLSALSMPMEIEGHSLQVSTSIGIALIPDHGDNPGDLLKRADIALYRVKESGRNGIAFFEQAMQLVASERLAIESELRMALASSEFVVYYQPQFDTQAQRVVGGEALMRWNHPHKGLIGPAAFMDILEESSMIVEAGAWVLQQSCRFVAELISGGHIDVQHFSMSVNISPRQFRQPGFVEQVKNAILPLGIPPSCIKLEITEGVVIQDINDTVEKMQELRRFGVLFAIDDFGTGYSSLSYLKRLPLDLIKIDQSFVRDCTEKGNDTEIIRAIIAIARNLGLEMIAEGVETAEQLDFLKQQSCHCYQGYLFSPPVSAQEFVELLGSAPPSADQA